MQLIQLFLPIHDRQHKPFPPELHASVKTELTEKFEGLTAYNRAPAEGRWNETGALVRDDMVIYEVMTDDVDDEWWEAYRKRLEEQFDQDDVLIRALPMKRF